MYCITPSSTPKGSEDGSHGKLIALQAGSVEFDSRTHV